MDASTIKTEADISSDVARILREQSMLSQKEFWSRVGITQSGGCRYEQDHKIPRPVRILLFANYVAGLCIDATSKTGAAHLLRLARINASDMADRREEIGVKLLDVSKSIQHAKNVLDSVA